MNGSGKGSGDVGRKKNARDRKRERQTIALPHRSDSSSVAFSSTTAAPSVDPIQLAEARAFEISAMESAVARAGDGTGMRPFQLLPIHLRRRAASHNPKRIPVAHRQRSLNDTSVTSRPTPRYKRRRGADAYLKRSLKENVSQWLPTHIWHAKRASIKDLWGFKVPFKYHQKSLRSTIKAGKHASLLWDASFHQIIHLTGPLTLLALLLEKVSPNDPVFTREKYMQGSKWGSAMIYLPGQYPYDAVAPVSFLWRPCAAASSFPDHARDLWLIVHPSSTSTILCSLTTALDILDLDMDLPDPAFDPSTPSSLSTSPSSKISITTLNDVSQFEILGSKSHQILQRVLELASPSQPAAKAWAKSMKAVRSPQELPPNIVLGFDICDPALNFPPRKIPPTGTGATFESWPTDGSLSDSNIWSLANRTQAGALKLSTKQIGLRKSAQNSQISETSDPRIPILLLLLPTSTPLQSGYRIILPSSYSMSLFQSLTFASCRPICLSERKEMNFSAGTPMFPFDFPETQAWEEWSRLQGAEKLQEWKKKPPAKRVNFEKLKKQCCEGEIEGEEFRWWMSDFERILDSRSPVDLKSHLFVQPSSAMDQECRHDDAQETDMTRVSKVSRPTIIGQQEVRKPMYIITGPLLSKFKTLCDDAIRSGTMNSDAVLSCFPLETGDDDERLDVSLSDGFVRIHVDCLARGRPEDDARMYEPLPKEIENMTRAMEERKNFEDLEWSYDGHPSFKTNDSKYGTAAEAPPISQRRPVSGYITSGSYSLLHGRGTGIATIKADALIRILVTFDSCVVFRNVSSETLRMARVRILE